jgi:hypothetical protein
MDAALRPAFYAELVGRVAEHQMEIVEHLLQIPVDGIMFGDGWGCQRGAAAGNILSGSKHLQPETPTKNAAAVVELFLEQAGVDLAEYRT